MAIIKSISDLRYKYNQMSELADSTDEPIFIMKKGSVNLVVMSKTNYPKMKNKLDLLGKLLIAQNQKAKGDKGRTLKNVMHDIRNSL